MLKSDCGPNWIAFSGDTEQLRGRRVSAEMRMGRRWHFVSSGTVRVTGPREDGKVAIDLVMAMPNPKPGNEHLVVPLEAGEIARLVPVTRGDADFRFDGVLYINDDEYEDACSVRGAGPPKVVIPGEGASRGARLRILYVENHAVFAANVISQFLSQHSVSVAPSLAEARRVLAAGSFDLLLVDYDLDDGKGDALVNEVHASGKAVAVIGVSSHEEGNTALLRAGAVAVCSKMQFDRIQSVIDTVTAHTKTSGSSLLWWVIPGALAGMPMPFIHPERRLNMGGTLTAYDDELPALHNAGIRAVVSLLNIPSDAAVYESAGFVYKCLPVPDGGAPTAEQAQEFIAFVDRQLAARHPVAVHCEAGLGRTGTMLAAYLISQGNSAELAIRRVRAAEGSAVETPRQIQFLEDLAAMPQPDGRILNEGGRMVTVYNLRRDKRSVESVQRATLTTKQFGIEQTHGLFGSAEWWGQIATGKLPVERLCGVITRMYMGSMNDWPEFSMRSDAGEEVSWSRYANGEHLADFYAVGRRVEIDYVVQRHRAASFNGGAETKCVIEVRIGTDA